MAEASIKDVAKFFKIGDGSTNEATGDPRNALAAFAKEWSNLSDDAKKEIREGVAAAQ